MELFAVLKILAIMFSVVFGSGYSLVYVFFKDRDVIEKAVMSGVFGMAQVFVTFFLIKTFFVLEDAIWATFFINGIILAYTIAIRHTRNKAVTTD